MASEYSDKEVALFQALGLGHLVPHLSPAPFYRMAMEKAFVEGWSGPAVVTPLGIQSGHRGGRTKGMVRTAVKAIEAHLEEAFQGAGRVL